MAPSSGSNSQPQTAWYVPFGGHVALVTCDQPPLRDLLAVYLRHCQAEPAPAIISYLLTRQEDNCFQLQRDEVILYKGPQLSYIVERLLHDLALTLTTHCQDYLVFHAAVLARAPHGLLLCGESGSGKSTLAAWLTASGFDYVTDELAAVSLEHGDVSGLTRPIVLKKGSAFVWQRWLDKPARDYLTSFANRVFLLDPEWLRPQSVQHVAQPRLILFPRYVANRAFEARPLSHADTLFHLLHRLINATNLPGNGYAGIKRLTHQTAAYTLTYPDVTTAAAWLQHTVTKLT